MTRFITKTAIALAVLASSLSLAPSAAKADHRCYKYTGQCFNYSGEAQMIRALEILELTYFERNDFIRHDLVEQAEREIVQARWNVRSGVSRQYLQLADSYLHYFSASCNPIYLDQAANYISQALAYEARLCQQPVIVHHGGYGGHAGHAGHGGHNSHHNGGFQGGGFPGGGFPQQQFGKSKVNFSQGGLHIGGKKGGITIKW